VLAAPSASGKCEGAAGQVIPTARACGPIQAALCGRAVANLPGLPLNETAAGRRALFSCALGGQWLRRDLADGSDSEM